MGKHSIKELLKTIQEKDKEIRSLELELSKTKVNSKMNKTKVQEELKWTGEETTFVETVILFCQYFLFPNFKFLKDEWKEILPEKKNSLYLLCMRHLRNPEGANESDIWERVIVPSIMRKYQHMKCNLNNDIKSMYMSMITCLCHYDFAVIVNYTYIDFLLFLNTADEKQVYPDELGNGFQDYIYLKIENVVYQFMCTYVRRIKPNSRWKKLLMNIPVNPFICCITPSDIAYVLAIIKNEKEICDQAKNLAQVPRKR